MSTPATKVPAVGVAGTQQVLGKVVTEFGGVLATVPAPSGVKYTRYESDEVTGTCPVTGQPDQYVVTIEVIPLDRLPESKSLKLYLKHLTGMKGSFCEDLSATIALDILGWLGAREVACTVKQKSRGGITILSRVIFRSEAGEGALECTPPQSALNTLKGVG